MSHVQNACCFQVIEKYLSGGMCGYDREGSPIWYDVIGPVDPKGLFLSASKQDFIKSKIRDCEMLQKECSLQSQRVNSRGRCWLTQFLVRALKCSSPSSQRAEISSRFTLQPPCQLALLAWSLRASLSDDPANG